MTPVSVPADVDYRPTVPGAQGYSVHVHTNGMSAAAIREDIRLGLTGHPKTLRPKYFYDSHGSALFEQITQLPEYYLTRTEQALLGSLADELMEEIRPTEVIELGTGPTAKIRRLLGATTASDFVRRYVPFDLDEGVVRTACETLVASYPPLQAWGVVGDFDKDLRHVPPPIGRRLVVFFGSTIGNLEPAQRHDFLVQVHQQLSGGDRFLLGLDLVKDTAVLETAYNDGQGVTAAFNRNILRVVNRAVGADFQPDAYEHRAFYNRPASRIEMHLAPPRTQHVSLRGLGIDITVAPGETVWTESSHKFTQRSAAAMLEEAGFNLERWYTDTEGMFALALAGA